MNKNFHQIISIATLVSFVVLIQPLQGQTTTWQGSGTTAGDMSDATNWSPQVVPDANSSTTTGVFTSGAATLAPFLSSGEQIQPLTFQINSGNYTFSISSASLDFGSSGFPQGGGITNPSGVAQTFTVDGGSVIFFGNTSVNDINVTFNCINGGGVSFSPDTGVSTVVNNATFTMDGASSLQFSGPCTSGSSGISNAGTLNYFNGASADTSQIAQTGLAGCTISGTGATAANATFHSTDNATVGIGGGATAGASTLVFNSSASMSVAGDGTCGTASITLSDNTNATFGNASSDTATAGSSTIVANNSASLNFNDHTTAGTSIITLNNTTAMSFGSNSTTDFSTAGSSNITLNGTSTATFNTQTTAGAATFNLAGTSQTQFLNQSTASTSIFNASSGTGVTLGASGGSDTCSANSAILNMTGATLAFNAATTAATSTINLTGGSLSFNDSSNAASSGINTDSTSTVAFNQTVDSAYAGSISGSGGVSLNSNVMQTFTGNSSAFSGNTIVFAGSLKMNGSLGGTTTMDAGTTLSGTGTLHNLRINNGATIAPGNSIGTLFVTGNYTQGEGSFYDVQINNEGQSSLIDVTGIATLNGGTVQVTTLDTVSLAQRYTILHANGGVNGTFTGVTFPSAILSFSLVYDPNNVYLQVGNRVVFAPLVRTTNQLHVAVQLENLFNDDPNPAELAFLDTLIPLTTPEIQNVLDLLSGEQYASLIQIEKLTTRRFLRQLYDPLRYELFSYPCSCDCGCDEPFYVWTDVQGGRTFVQSNHISYGFNDYNYDATIGAQTRLDTQWIVGAAANYEYDHLKYDLAGHGRVHTGQGALYAAFMECEYYLFSDLIGGWSNFKVVRPIEYSTDSFTAFGNTHLYHATSYTEGGWNFPYKCFMFQPFAGIDLSYFGYNRIREQGTDVVNLDIRGKSLVETYSRVGVHLFADVFEQVLVSTDLVWVRRFRNRDHLIHVAFQDFGDLFTIYGVNEGQNAFEGAVNVAKTFSDTLTVYGEFSGEVWNHMTNYEGTLGLIFEW